MAVPIIMPRQGQSVETCIITNWYKKKGDIVNIGDLLFSYETDKASFEEEAQVSGTLLGTFFNEGDDVPVLTNICVIGEPGEDIEKFRPKEGITQVKETGQEEKPKKKENKKIEDHVPQSTEIKISPRAKKLARKIGVDLRLVTASGPGGRIVAEDIVAFQQKGAVGTFTSKEMLSGKISRGTGLGGRITVEDLEKGSKISEDFEEVKHSNIRKTIAKAMYHSLSTTAQLTLHSSFNASDILSYRKKIKASQEIPEEKKATINDIILFTVSRTLVNHKSLNAHYFDDRILIFKNMHLGIAVDTERGLMVPTLFEANEKSLSDIAEEAKSLAALCQKGTINPDKLRGATFTVTNLGTLGIEMFTPILNPPQVAILGVNTITYKMKEINKEIIIYPSLGLSITFDHRALDGAVAARFLQELNTNLENFTVFISKTGGKE